LGDAGGSVAAPTGGADRLAMQLAHAGSFLKCFSAASVQNFVAAVSLRSMLVGVAVYA
jgi:hypothetical protein